MNTIYLCANLKIYCKTLNLLIPLIKQKLRRIDALLSTYNTTMPDVLCSKIFWNCFNCMSLSLMLTEEIHRSVI